MDTTTENQSNLTAPDGSLSIWQIFYQTFTEPRRFFSTQFSKVTTAQALVVGAVSVVVKSVLVWIVGTLKNESYLDHFKTIIDQADDIPALKLFPIETLKDAQSHFMPEWILKLGGLAMTPFTAIFGILMFAIMLTIGNAIFGKRETTWDSLFKLAALGNVPLVLGGLLSFLPLGMGEGLAGLYSSILVLIGLVDSQKIDGLRALAIVYATPLLFLLVCGCFVAAPIALIVALFFNA